MKSTDYDKRKFITEVQPTALDEDTGFDLTDDDF
jgi:hypothetical protein